MLVHHPNRGIHYHSALCQALHKRHGVQCSMTDCYESALAARVNGILKHELLLCRANDLEQARLMVGEAIRSITQSDHIWP